MPARRFSLLLLAAWTCFAPGCRKAPTKDVTVSEWRGVLNQVLRSNPPGDAHFAENVWRWSGRLFQQAAISKRGGPHREDDRKALIEWAVLAYYAHALDLEKGPPSVFVTSDQEMMGGAMKHAVETFGQPTMEASWEHFAALWKEDGLPGVESPFH